MMELQRSQTNSGAYAPTLTTDVGELLEWCDRYGRVNKYQQSGYMHFNIGIYQIHQGMKWARINSTYNVAESYCAAAIHFLIATTKFGLKVDELFPKDFKEIETRPMSWLAMEILEKVSEAEQMAYYGSRNHAGIMRASKRFDPAKLTKSLADLIVLMFKLVPSHNREQGILDATIIMTGAI